MKRLLLIINILIVGFSYSQDKSSYDSLLLNLNENELIPGYSIIVANFDSVIYQRNYGFSNIRNKIPISKETKFRIGSVSKQFTAAAILKLIEEDKLSLTTSARDYVPFLHRKITIEHLLTHTSGLVCYFSDLDFPDSCYSSTYNAKDLVYLLKGKKRISKPDKEYHYNNSAYHILGYILEKVSGKSYSDYLQEFFFTPLEMKNTECEYASSNIKNLGLGYEYIDSNYATPDYYTMDWPYSAGNIVSTPADLLKWNNALFQSKVISDSLLAIAHTSKILKNGESTHYGYGWEIRSIQDKKSVRHSGFLEGYLSTSIFIPEDKISVIVLTNCSNYSTELFATKLAALAMGKPIYTPKEMVLNEEELKTFENSYTFANEVIIFRIIDGSLCFYFEYAPLTYHPLYPTEKNQFYSTEYGCIVTFDALNNSMILKIGERETKGKKLSTTKPKMH